MNLRYRQRGMTLMGMLVIMILVISGALAAMRIVPLYMSNMTVRGSLESLVSDPEMRAASTVAIRRKLQSLFDVNDIRTVDSKAVTIKRAKGGREVRLNYEARAPMVSNLEVVARFDESVVLPEH
jgi:hypothetical protein